MEISKEVPFMVNRGFGGNLRSGSSIDFALDLQKSKKLGEYKKLAYLIKIMSIIPRIKNPICL
ncbi:hypothetical protein J4433_00215 [Candidatus Pacearchaeota archaeon]|nr:hypothetical protein [Candidatus Pacearchaeota archaeon]